ncbi:MAG: PHP domain-containing protein [Gammaproteobacteria bacterium]|nr:PHP domain-containing protein [Gammaproteobacteria bacterium]
MSISHIVPGTVPAKYYDLHSHSLHSDGTLTPSELVQRAQAAGVEVLALTDHDVTDGLDEAMNAADRHGIKLIAGVEISVTWNNQTLHILGLNIDPGQAELQQGLARLREFRVWRAQEIGRRLEKKKITGAYAGAVRLAKGSIISRSHFARFLFEQGYVRGFPQAFRQFLSRGKPGFVPGQWTTLGEAVNWIVAAGGQAVVAHPARYKLSAGKLRLLLNEFRECGGTAIEVISGSHTPEASLHFAGISREHGLLASAGSDYHGPENYTGSETGHASACHEGANLGGVTRQKTWSGRGLGKLPPLPDGCTPVWRDWESNAPTTRAVLA